MATSEPAGLPLVSCIMPTADRRRFVPRAVRYFLAQDYPARELVVVDDGADAVADLMPAGDARVRYVRLDRRATVGAKRNIACGHARGDLVAHWDDDDWHAPHRLAAQVRALCSAPAARLCGLTTLLFYDPRRGQGWRYSYPPGQGRHWLAGSSLLYARAFWARHRFAEVDQGEDGRFVARAGRDEVHVMAEHRIHVGVIHADNVSPKHTHTAWWQPCPDDEIRGVVGDAWAELRADAPGPSAGPGAAGVTPPSAAPPARNVFACLVHESAACADDLVRNLQHLDPASAVLLYNGGSDPQLLSGGGWGGDGRGGGGGDDDGRRLDRRPGVTVHPQPRPMAWGTLHGFAVDCMRLALAQGDFDTLTIVDSDQLAIRPGYSGRIGRHLADHPRVGLLGNAPGPQPPTTQIPPAKVAFAEVELWRPFLRRFPDGERKFCHWSFWPSTVFTAAAARGLVRLFDEDDALRDVLARTRIWATEEVILPTLVALLGFEVGRNPCSYDYVKYRTPYSAAQAEAAMARPDVFWLHPVPRRIDDPLRRQVRERFGRYGSVGPVEGGGPAGPPRATTAATAGAWLPAPPTAPPLVVRPPPAAGPDGRVLPTLPLLERVRRIEGWLDDAEADLLAAVTRAAAAAVPGGGFVEVGCLCGKATVVVAATLRAAAPGTRLHAVDPHDGKVGAAGRYVTVAGSLDKLRANLAAAGLADVVTVVVGRAADVPWDGPLAFLLVDGLHDRDAVAADFGHFSPHLPVGAYVAFHDYAAYFPGVVAVVNGLLDAGGWDEAARAGTLVVLRKRPAPAPATAAPATAVNGGTP